MTKQEFVQIVKSSKNKQDVIHKMGRKYCGYSQRLLNRLCVEFDVDISNLNGRRTFDILKHCKECGKDFLSRKAKKATNFCSKTCGRKYSQKHVNIEKLRSIMREKVKDGTYVSWNRGKKFTIEGATKHGNMKIVTRKEYMCSWCKKPFKQTDHESRGNKLCVCSKECRSIYLPKVQSDNLKKQYENGKKVYGGTTKWLQYKDIKVQGTYEFRSCKIFDKMIEKNMILGWEYSPCRIKYHGVDGSEHNYLIDFRIDNLDGTHYFVETKGWVRENDEAKWKSARDRGYDLRVWFLSDIEQKERELFI